MKKIDFKKQDKYFYEAKNNQVSEIDVPALQFLQLTGRGDPSNSEIFSKACEALFSVSYKIKFSIKKSSIDIDYSVMPLEGLWWVNHGEFNLRDKSNWDWVLMVRQPDFVTEQHFNIAVEEVKKKKGHLGNLSKLRLEKYHEGLSAQILHVGAYAEEQSTIGTLHHYVKQNNYVTNGKHHEIYLNDPTKTAPQKLKTIIRQPIKVNNDQGTNN